jgi:hypothetical protein
VPLSRALARQPATHMVSNEGILLCWLGYKAVCGRAGRSIRCPFSVRKARAKNKPYLSPHGFFRKLQFGDNERAKEFLEIFGPLKLEVGTRLRGTGPVVVDLCDLWSSQLRFCLIANVWESLGDRKQLATALLNCCLKGREISKYEKFSLGQEFGPPPAFERRGEYEFPWQLQRQAPTTWLESAPMREMQGCALQLILLELNAHTRDLRIVWERGWETSGRKFREMVWIDSLWSAIWELWGWDTIGLSWRRCPHCERFFYPKRHDQFYCTPRQQALWSKRRYSAERRAQERQRKREKMSTRRAAQ